MTDDNYKKIVAISAEKGCSMNDVVNQCISNFSENNDDKTTLQNMKCSLRENEHKLNILYSALNNFFLNFAPNMEEYVSPDTALHTWIERAANEEESKSRQLATKKKWTGNNPKSPDEKR